MPPAPQKPLGSYPRTRLRRTRRTAWSRRLVAENRLSPCDLLWPVFTIDGEGRREPVASMPGVDRLSIDLLVDAVGEAEALGIPAVAVFPSIAASLKTPDGSEALNPENLICRAVRAIKAAHPGIGVICDVALDPYSSEGHDGLVHSGRVLNDETVALLCRQAVVQAQAGCDIVAPSDMMD
ncbi:MAG TPA: porphobilinogen synthase, partial [Rhodospirillales bacterium]|nr:porphobilinogen synthase [Rhodospirillales bacterium]